MFVKGVEQLRIVWGAIAPNIVGAAWGSTMLVVFGMVTEAALPITFGGWFLGNTIPTIILGSVVLKFVSPLVIRNKAFVKRWWA
jgi:integral membrane sensor domain MASE1